jgi:hypothetical protein
MSPPSAPPMSEMFVETGLSPTEAFVLGGVLVLVAFVVFNEIKPSPVATYYAPMYERPSSLQQKRESALMRPLANTAFPVDPRAFIGRNPRDK